jgi:hypothetical protein
MIVLPLVVQKTLLLRLVQAVTSIFSIHGPSRDGDLPTALWWAQADLGVRFMGILDKNVQPYAIYLRSASFT